MKILINENIADVITRGMWKPSTNDNIGLYITRNRISFVDFYLFNENIEPLGMIVIDKINDGYMLRYVWGKKGYGAAMYEIALNWINTTLMSDKEIYSNDKAFKIWEKYYLRNDVEKIPIEKDSKWFQFFHDEQKNIILNQKYKLKSQTMNIDDLLKIGNNILINNNIEKPTTFLWNKFMDYTNI